MKVDPHPLRILIIDDEIDISRLLSRFLEKKGFAVQSAENIGDGKDLYQQQRYSYLILNCRFGAGNWVH